MYAAVFLLHRICETKICTHSRISVRCLLSWIFLDDSRRAQCFVTVHRSEIESGVYPTSATSISIHATTQSSLLAPARQEARSFDCSKPGLQQPIFTFLVWFVFRQIYVFFSFSVWHRDSTSVLQLKFRHGLPYNFVGFSARLLVAACLLF